MANELTTNTNNVPAAAELTAGQVFQSLLELARDPSVDAGKMSSLVDLQMKMMDYSKQEEFNKAKIAAIMEMPSIGKRGEIKNKTGGVQSRYSRFEDIHRAVMPILKRNNLVISFDVGHNGQMVTVTPILSHTNGFVEKGEAMSLPIDTTGSKNGTQGAGSAASYGKRHSMKAMLNIIESADDDDGMSTGKLDDLQEQASNAASCGMAAYERWFKSDISADERKQLAANGWHDQMKDAAAKSDAQRETGEEPEFD